MHKQHRWKKCGTITSQRRLNSSEKARFSRCPRTALTQTQPRDILFGWLTCSLVSAHELVLPFYLLILGLDNIFL